MAATAIRSKRILTGNQFFHGVVFIENGKITLLSDSIPSEYDGHIIDCGTDVVMPGIIDAHVHINEPGRTEWEGFETATRSAAAGGITTVIEMPLNADPVTTTVPNLILKLKAAHNKLFVNTGFYGGVIPGNENEIEGLIRNGVFGIKAFLTHSGIDSFPAAEEKELVAALKILKQYDLPLLVHAELSISHDDQNEILQDHGSYKAYLKSRPKWWEDKAIEMLIRLCRESGARIHIVHLSSADSLRQIAKAKREGLPLTVETAPHYLFFNAENIPDHSTIYKCAPPIREKTNNEKLWTALKDGLIDFIATDHSPAPSEMKKIESGDLLEAWGGISGLQFMLPAIWKKGFEKNISLIEISKWLSEKPAQFLNLKTKGRIEKGMDADLFIFNPEVNYIPEKDDIHFRHKISPYVGQKLKGRILQTFVNGERVFDKEKFNQTAGRVLINEINN